MVWRKSSTMQERILACLTYLVPILEALIFGFVLFALIPPLKLIFSPLFLLAPIYFYSIGGIAVIPFVAFFAIYVGIVQNQTLSHFLRFNAMQALLLAVFAWLCSALLKLFGMSQSLMFGGFGATASSVTAGLLESIVFSAIFIAVVGASIYSVVQSLRGQYAEMPLISEAAHSQVR